MLARQNFSVEAEEALNKQINEELRASYVYMSMGTYFGRDDVALHNIAAFFNKQSVEERGHALMLVEHVNQRGGRVQFSPISPPNSEWKGAKDAFESALSLEKEFNQNLLNICKLAEDHGDYRLADFIQGFFLKEQVESIKEFSDFVSQLNLAGDGVGLFMFDKHLGQ